MVEVFITDVVETCEVMEIVAEIEQTYSELKISFDMDETGLPFPEGHTVLRVEGAFIDPKTIVQMVKQLGFGCDIMEDTIPQ